tara:strand:- start:3663 stop:3929 length:267 start_codon:yes stop_codon:yes gene_type:complete
MKDSADIIVGKDDNSIDIEPKGNSNNTIAFGLIMLTAIAFCGGIFFSSLYYPNNTKREIAEKKFFIVDEKVYSVKQLEIESLPESPPK